MLTQSRFPQSLITTKTEVFDYATLDKDIQVQVKKEAVMIKELVRNSAQNVIEIGQKLNEVQQKLGYGHFRRWLTTEFNWSVSKATKLMQVAERFKSVNFTHLNFGTSALYLLAAPSTPETARQEALNIARKGRYISHSLAKTIVKQHKKASWSQEDGLDITAEVEPDGEKLTETSVNCLLSPSDDQRICQVPANPAKLDPVGGNKLRAYQELPSESEIISDLGKGIDELTKISDGNFFKKCLKREWGRLIREKGFLSLIWCSIDHFLLFNRQSSDYEKESCLAKVVQALESNVRRSTDLISYFGGEKFIIALPNTNLQGAKKVAEAIAASVRQFQIPYPQWNNNGHVTVSLGIAGTVPMPELSLERLVAAVEKALLKAQKQGGNCAIISDLEIGLQ